MRPGSCTRNATSALVLVVGAMVALACSGDEAPGATSASTLTPPSSVPTSDSSSASLTQGPAATTPVTDSNEAVGGVDPTRCDPAAALATPTAIEWWSALDRAGGQTVARLVERFEFEHPGITVEVRDVQGYSQIIDELRDTPRESSPDLVMGSVNDLQRLRDSGRFLTPSTCAPTLTAHDDLLPVVAATYTSAEGLVAVPFNVSTPVLLYDRARFAAAGLDPDDPPTTPDEVRSALEVLEAADPSVDGLVLYDRAASWLLDQWSAQDGRLLLEPGNGIDRPVSDVTVDTAANRASLAWAADLVTTGLATTVGTNTSGIDDLVKMVDGERPGSMTFHTSASLGDVLSFRDALADEDRWDIGVGALPGPGTGSLVGGAALWLVDHGVDSGAAATGAAWLLADWLLQPAQQAELAAMTGYVPAVSSAVDEPTLLDRWAAEPILEVGFRQLESTPAGEATIGMRVGPRVDVERSLELAAAAVIAGADPARELVLAEREIAVILERYSG